MSLSLYRTKELGLGSRLHSATQYADHSFIALLALAQRLEISLLPITWQALLNNLGQGGQARISQASANVQTSFAFKRFREDLIDEDTPFQAVINEMIMLSHHAIRDHPFVVTLEGICWDIPGDGDQVWPVLIFEMSIHGDLFDFVKAGRGSSLSTQEKLKLCTDIGIAIRDMHSNNIIHGDIKPQNVLIFPDNGLSFIAKMADFGFSIGFQDEKDRIFFPLSRPWNAPEHHGRHFSPEEAKRMDIYSFGLLCFWFLFGTCGQLPLAPWMQYDAESISFEGDSESLGVLEYLKENEDDDLLRWIVWIINRHDDLNDSERNNLKQFFRFTLVRKPDQRNMDYNDLLLSLAPHRAIQLPLTQFQTDFLLEEEHFEIQSSIVEFYQADFRLRTYIAKSLLLISQHSPTALTRHISPQKAAFQLALCYKIGFGVPKNNINASKLLEQNFQSWDDLECEISTLKSAARKPTRQSGIYMQMENQGFVLRIDLPQHYRERNLLQTAERYCLQEIRDIHEELGDAHNICVILKDLLGGIYKVQGQWAKAEELEDEVVKICSKVLGLEHPSTMTSIENLASTYSRQGQWVKAEELESQLLKTKLRVLGLEHPHTLTTMSNLASTHRNQGSWAKAEELEAQVVQISSNLLGLDHMITLASKANLALTYRHQGYWSKAEELEVHVLERSLKTLGPEHPHTLASITNLALTLSKLGQWNKVEELAVQVVETSSRILGAEHPDTLASLGLLASAYSSQGRWAEAGELSIHVMKTTSKVLGLEHPYTLTSMANLAETYFRQKLWIKAEELYFQVLETRKRVLGPEHPDTLTSMASLASTYYQREYSVAAKRLEVQGLEIRKRVLGPEHPDTLLSIRRLAMIFDQQRCWAEATELGIQALELSKRVHGPEHRETLITIGNLASTYYRQECWDEAEKLWAQLMENSTVLGLEHASILECMTGLTSIYMKQQRWTQAKELLIQLIEIHSRVSGLEHPETLASMEGLAWMYWETGCRTNAEELQDQVEDIKASIALRASGHST